MNPPPTTAPTPTSNVASPEDTSDFAYTSGIVKGIDSEVVDGPVEAENEDLEEESHHLISRIASALDTLDLDSI